MRSEANPQRVDKSRTDFHSSYERSCSSKFLAGESTIGDRSKAFVNSLGIHDREKCFKVLAFDVTQGYDSTQRFVITDVELRKFGGEVDRVPREKISMNTVECTVDLLRFSVSLAHNTGRHTHQKCDISILEEKYVVPHERFVIFRPETLRKISELGSGVSRLHPSGFSGHHVCL